MACLRQTKRALGLLNGGCKLQSIGIRNTWIIVKNNTGDEMKADITLPEKQTNTQCPTILPGKDNSWPCPIGKYKVWLTDNLHSTAWFVINKTNEQDCIVDVGHHIHYHVENGVEEALPHALP